MIMLKLLPLLLLIYPFYKFYLDHKSHKRKMKNISNWGDFNKQCLEWAEEMQDKSVKDEYLNYLFEKISLFNSDKIFKNHELFDMENSKKEIIEKYGKHIPSLLIEVRDEKIDEILANESN